MSLHIGVLGTGGVGGYIGGHLVLAGEDAILISQRQANVEHIRRHGLRLTDTRREQVARPAVLHVGEARNFAARPLDVVFLCVKSYDTLKMTAVFLMAA